MALLYVAPCNLLNLLIFFTLVSHTIYSMLRLRMETRAEFTKGSLQPSRSKPHCSPHIAQWVLTNGFKGGEVILKKVVQFCKYNCCIFIYLRHLQKACSKEKDNFALLCKTVRRDGTGRQALQCNPSFPSDN